MGGKAPKMVLEFTDAMLHLTNDLVAGDVISHTHFEERPFGKWDVWMNVINVEADHGTTEAALFAAFYGEPKDWRTDSNTERRIKVGGNVTGHRQRRAIR